MLCKPVQKIDDPTRMRIAKRGGQTHAALMDDRPARASLGPAADLSPRLRIAQIPGDRMLEARARTRREMRRLEHCGESGPRQRFGEGLVDPAVAFGAGGTSRIARSGQSQHKSEVLPVLDETAPGEAPHRPGGEGQVICAGTVKLPDSDGRGVPVVKSRGGEARRGRPVKKRLVESHLPCGGAELWIGPEMNLG